MPLFAVDLPRGTFDFTQIAEAKKKAAEEKKQIAYLYTEKDSTCGLCNAAAEEFIKAVRGKGIIVHLESSRSKEYWINLPKTLHAPLSKGEFIPRLVVTEADGQTVIASLDYVTHKADPNSSIRELKKKLRE